MRDGLIDYLEIMQMAGVSELAPPLNVPTNTNFSAAIQEPKIEDYIDTDINADIADPIETNIIDTDIVETDIIETNIETDIEINTVEPDEEILPAHHSNKSKAEQLRMLAAKVSKCSLCDELTQTRTQTVFGVGNPDAQLVFLGEAPGADEDKQGEPFVGRAGQLLNDIITKGMKLRREDVYICNILRCRPPGNRNPLPEEEAHCRPFLDGTLEIVKPKFICCLGAVAAQNLLQTMQSIGSMRGKVLDYKGIKVVCTYHPAYLLRNPAAKKLTWDDIQILMNEMGLVIGNK